MLEEKLKRKYAKMCTDAEVGIWVPNRYLVGMEYGTWSEAEFTKGQRAGESYNQYDVLRRHNYLMHHYLKRQGLDYEYWMCGGVSPESSLWHLHGLWAFPWAERPDIKELHSIVSEAWGKWHDSPVVWVQNVFNPKGAMNYAVKHALNNYFEAGGSGRRALISRRWFPFGYTRVRKILVRWYLDHRYPVWAEEGVSPLWDDALGVENDKDYVAFAKEVMHDLLWRWCNDEEVKVEIDGYEFLLYGDSILERKVNSREDW